MKINFKTIAVLTALIFFTLALTWMFAPTLFLSHWGVELTTSAGLVGRRAAALYAGIGVMLFAARNAEPSPSRSALTAGLVVTCLSLAALGGFEIAAGNANCGILAAVLIEVALASAFLYVKCAHKKTVTLNEKRRMK